MLKVNYIVFTRITVVIITLQDISPKSTVDVSVNFIYKSSEVLLQEAKKKVPATKTLLMRYYSKRSGFRGRLKCPEPVS